MRRIGVLIGYAEDDPETKARLAGFRQGLGKRGWSEGRNVQIDYRFASAMAGQYEPLAQRAGRPATRRDPRTYRSVAAALQRESRTIPIVFLNVSDPIGAGFIASLARPGGNLTGVLHYEAEHRRQMACDAQGGRIRALRALLSWPTPRRAPLTISSVRQNPQRRRSRSSLCPVPVENAAADIERAIKSLARVPNDGLLLPPDGTTIVHRDLIIALAARHRLPAVYSLHLFVAAGGLMSYGTDQVDMFRQAASYVDRILRGDKPADLPVQAPTKYETTVNLKTAKALGLTVPPGLLVAADEVIE